MFPWKLTFGAIPHFQIHLRFLVTELFCSVKFAQLFLSAAQCSIFGAESLQNSMTCCDKVLIWAAAGSQACSSMEVVEIPWNPTLANRQNSRMAKTYGFSMTLSNVCLISLWNVAANICKRSLPLAFWHVSRFEVGRAKPDKKCSRTGQKNRDTPGAGNFVCSWALSTKNKNVPKG